MERREPSVHELRAFALRDWERLAEMKRAAWLERKRKLGSTTAFSDAAELFQWVRRVRPDWPSEQDRALDLEHHGQLNRLFDRFAERR